METDNILRFMMMFGDRLTNKSDVQVKAFSHNYPQTRVRSIKPLNIPKVRNRISCEVLSALYTFQMTSCLLIVCSVYQLESEFL